MWDSKGTCWCLVYLVLLVEAIPHLTKDDSLVIRTKSGPVRGLTTTSPEGQPVDLWLSIPYATPPLGQLRFKAPLPIEPWEAVKDTTKKPNACFQIYDNQFGNFSGASAWNPVAELSEDCLYLSIAVPNPRPENVAVLVFIHAGGFYSGATTLDVYDPRTLAAGQRVIVVSMQYRLASLGFLYFDSPEVPGNMGLLDQTLAMKWIHENIASFGGNPQNITLMGLSAGAAAVSLHLLSKLSNDYYNQAIMQGGSATANWATVPNEVSILKGLRLAAAVGCPHNQSDLKATIDCLRTTDANILVSNEFGPNDAFFDVPFVPVVDGHFLTETPAKSLERGDFKKAKILLGSNTDEGSVFLLYYATDLFPLEENVEISREQFLKVTPKLNPKVNPIARDAIIFEYTDWLRPDDPVLNREALVNMVGDYQITCGVQEVAERYADTGNDVYLYKFDHRTSASPWPKWLGVLHVEEVAFMFGEPLDKSKGYLPSEVNLSQRIMGYWANFARSGNPNNNPDGTLTTVDWPTSWPLHTTANREYLQFGVNDTVGHGFRTRECAFWTKYLPKLIEKTNGIYEKPEAKLQEDD